MSVEKGPRFAESDVYVDYPFESVRYRWDHLSEKVFVKFYGKSEHDETVPTNNRLFTDALLSGTEITKAEYDEA